MPDAENVVVVVIHIYNRKDFRHRINVDPVFSDNANINVLLLLLLLLMPLQHPGIPHRAVVDVAAHVIAPPGEQRRSDALCGSLLS